MPKPLTTRQIARLTDGTHRVAPSLYLQVRGRSRLWTLRYSLHGKARSMSLGSVESLPLEAAMAAAAAARAKVRLENVDVLAERRALRTQQRAAIVEARAQEPQPIRKSGHTLGELLDVATPLEARAKNWKPHPTACARWIAPIKKHCGTLVNKDVSAITEAALVEVLTVPWVERHLQAMRALTRTITLMGHARRLGWIAANPLVLERIKEKLPAMPKRRAKHHPAMPLRDVPGFMQSLATDDDDIGDLFRFLVLVGTRCNEAAGMRWSEVDMANQTWTIPGGTPESRLKKWQHGDHRAPLSDSAMAILKTRQDASTDARDGLVFPAPDGKPYASSKLLARLAAKGYPQGVATVHGFRTCLRGFLAEHVAGEYWVKELCLTHETRNDTQTSYDRGDALHERRGMMQAWSEYLAGRVTLDTTAAVVLPLRNALAIAA